MNISAGTLRRLDVLSLAVLAASVVLYVWPVSIPKPDETASLPAIVRPRVAAEPDTLDARQVVNANILSASRRAPQRRYVSPELASASEFSMPAAFAPSTDSSNAKSGDADAVPGLYGTVNTDGVWRALLRLSSSDPNPLLLKEGDQRGGYRVVSIRSNAVVVAGPSGPRTLRLAQPARGDSMGKTP